MLALLSHLAEIVLESGLIAQIDNIWWICAGPSEAETPEIITAHQPELLFRPTKRCRINEGADATVYSPASSPEGMNL